MTVVIKTLSWDIFFSKKQIRIPKISPNKGPPNEVLTKSKVIPVIEVDSPLSMLKRTIKSTIELPSLKRDSPSNKVLNLAFEPIYFKRAIVATGSVGESMQPNVSA